MADVLRLVRSLTVEPLNDNDEQQPGAYFVRAPTSLYGQINRTERPTSNYYNYKYISNCIRLAGESKFGKQWPVFVQRRAGLARVSRFSFLVSRFSFRLAAQTGHMCG